MTQIPMSPAPAERVRPAVVTASSGLLVFLVVLLVLSSVLGVVAYNDDVRRAVEELSNDQSGGISPGLQQTMSVVTSVAFAVILLVLAALNLRGNQVSRIVTWVLGGIGVVCCACSLFFQGATGAILGAADETAKEAYERVVDAFPSWYMPASITISILSVLVLLAALILLALPAANEYFRKPAPPEWTPPPSQR